MNEPRYAWVVVWATFTGLAVIFGVAYSFAAFFESFASEFNAQRADVSLVFGLSGGIYFALGAGAGLLADRFGPRTVATAGMLCIAAGLAVGSQAQSMGTIYAAYALGIGVGVALVYTPSIACVQPWFRQRRGLAAGIASAGIGAGTVLFPLWATWLIATMQWRMALLGMAATVLVLGFGAVLLLRRAPHASDATPASLGLSLRETLKSRQFWWLYLSVAAASPGMFIPFAHVSASARDLGLGDAQAVGLVGLIGMGSLIGRFAMGALADRLGRLLTLCLAQASAGLAYLLWLAAGHHGLGVGESLTVFALWFGLSYGGIVSLLPAICMDLFGARAVASIIGTLYSGAALGNLLGPVLAGSVFDHTGSYSAVLWTCVGLGGLAALAAVRLGRSRVTAY